jgi:type IV pilus assembly protein PilV
MIRSHLSFRRALRGSFMLEALIAVLLVALGVLGLVGLLARSMQNIDDSKYRGEAAYLANGYIGQMWIGDRAALNARFSDSGGGAEYDEFKALVQQRLPNGGAPQVTIGAGPTPTSSIAQIRLTWQTPGSSDIHEFSASGTIGANK